MKNASIILLLALAGIASAQVQFDNDQCSTVATSGQTVGWTCTDLTPPPPPDPFQCADGIDNDGDGLIDLADPGCVDANDDDEFNEVIPPPPHGNWPIEVPTPPSAAGLPACGPLVDWPSNPTKFKELTGSNCVSDGETIVGKSLIVSGSNVHVLNYNIDGDGVDKNGVSARGSNIVIRNTKVGRLLGNDKHCFTVSQGGRNVWIIDSEGYYCSGDGFQAGHQASANPPTNVYLVRNLFWGNRENAIDLKYINNFIGVENVGYDHRRSAKGVSWCLPDDPTRCAIQGSGSDGTGVVIGSDGGPTGWAFYRNEMYNSDGGFRVEESNSTGIISGNIIRDITNFALQLDKNSGRIDFSDNRIANTGRGIFQNWRVNFALDVARNQFQNVSGPAIEYGSGSVCQASTLTDNSFSGTGPVICGNNSQSTAAGINSLPGASGNTVN